MSTSPEPSPPRRPRSRHARPRRIPLFWTAPAPILHARRESAGRSARTKDGRAGSRCGPTMSSSPMRIRAFRNPGVENLERSGIMDGPFYEWRKRSLAAHRRGGAQESSAPSSVASSRPRQVSRLRDGFRAQRRRRPCWQSCPPPAKARSRDRPRVRSTCFRSGPSATSWGSPTRTGKSWRASSMERRRPSRPNAHARDPHACRDERSSRSTPIASDSSSAALAHPGNDALSELVASRSKRRRRLGRESFLALIVNIFGGAVGSTSAAIANSIHLLLDRIRSRRTLVRREPERIKPADRGMSPSGSALSDRSAGGPTSPSKPSASTPSSPGEGDLHLARGGQSRPRAFRAPGRVRHRAPGPIRISASAIGPHFCLGHALARASRPSEAVLALLMAHHPNAELRDP